MLQHLIDLGFTRAPRFDNLNYECYLHGNLLAFVNKTKLAKGYLIIEAYLSRTCFREYSGSGEIPGLMASTDDYEIEKVNKFLFTHADEETKRYWKDKSLIIEDF